MRRIAALIGMLVVVTPAVAHAGALDSGATITTTPGLYSLPLVVTYTVADGGCPSGALTVSGFSTTFAAVTDTIALAGTDLEPGDHSVSIGAIPDGPSYTLTLTCGSASSVVPGISVRTAVVPPALVEPAAHATVDYPFQVSGVIQTPTDGTYQLVFKRSGHSVTLTEPGPTGSATFPAVVRTTIGARSGLTDGTYSVTLRYLDPLVHLEATSHAVTLTLSTETPPPTLHVASQTIGPKGEAVTYTLPTAALSVSLRLRGDGEYDVTLPGTHAGQHTVVLYPDDLAKTGIPTDGRVVRDGTYELSIGYRDAALHPAAFSHPVAVRVDKGTRPLDANVTTNSAAILGITVYLPEATDGKKLEVLIERSPLSASLLHVAVKPGLHTIRLQRNDLAATNGATGVSGPNTLPPGAYKIVLTYRDSAENAPFRTQLSVKLT